MMTYGGLTTVGQFFDWRPRNGSVRSQWADPEHQQPEARPSRRFHLGQALRSLRSRLAAPVVEPTEPDLIDHPAFREMSLRDLADLPFPRYAITDVAKLADPGTPSEASPPR